MLTMMTFSSYRYNSKEFMSLKELFSCLFYSLLVSCLLTEQYNKIIPIFVKFLLNLSSKCNNNIIDGYHLTQHE